MASVVDQHRAVKAAEAWPGVDLSELVPRSMAYREVYGTLERWAAEQTAHAFAQKERGLVPRLPAAWQEAGYRAASAIAEEIYVHMGNTARRYIALLPADPPPAVQDVVDVELPA